MAVVQTDQSLQWIDYEPIAAKIPQDIFYQQTTAQTSSTSGFSFYVITPASNALMDNEAYISYTITLTDTTPGDFRDQYEHGGANTNAGLSGGNGLHTALRQCWPMMRSMQNLAININGTVISCQPYMWADPMHRLYLSEEEAANICTLSGGEFDTGYRMPFGDDNNAYTAAYSTANINNNTLNMCINPGFGLAASFYQAASANTLTLFSPLPKDTQFYNDGFTKRFYRLLRYNREQQAPNQGVANNRYADTMTFQIFERIPISPFLLYDSRDYHMSIPHVRTMTLTAQYSSNARNLIVQQSVGIDDNTDLFSNTISGLSLTYAATAPVLHLKWIMSKDILPPNITIPAYIIREYQYGFTFPAMAVASTGVAGNTVQYNNVNLEGIPDLMLIYLRADPSNDTLGSPSEHYMSIDSLQLTIAGTTGKMNAITSQELYTLWLKNVVHRGIFKQGYLDWYRHGCVVALRPKDYGCLFGPGMDYPVQISATAGYSNLNVFPTYGCNNNVANVISFDNTNAAIAYIFNIICVYQRYSLSLNSGGGSRLSLLKVPLVNDAAIGQAPMQINP